MAAKSTLKNMALCLSAVCLICSAVVGGAYALTKEPIDEAAKAKTTASIARVLPAFTAEPELGTIELNGANYTYYCVPGTGVAIISATARITRITASRGRASRLSPRPPASAASSP